MYTVERLTADELEGAAGQLAALLLETVATGSSLGFLSSLDAEDAAGWWRALVPDVAAGRLLLWAARAEGADRIAGTVQLRPAVPANGRHRGEVAKLMVHPADRGQRLAGRLLATLEAGASERGIRLLVLDTETGSPAERMYAAEGWTRVGTVPDFATDPTGVARPTTVFYKQLAVAGEAPGGA
ncbi:GNAT family N-acetyltransferase [Kitasatospora sp. NPDC090091]|uniref:GNAT family N-acetyltransferase n=1 Tax=Kitasatospora sp. NPDC090091 TaxID=3364081 RepID=UPI003821D6EA